MLKKLIIITLVSCFFVSCAVNQLTLDSIQNIEKNYTSEMLSELTTPKKPEFEFYISHDERKFFIQTYKMVVRSESQMGQNYNQGGSDIASFQFGSFTPPPPPTFDPMMMPTSHTVTYTEPYAFIFENNLLIYWGFFEELNKSNDKVIIGLAPDIQTEYERLKEAQRLNP